MGNINRTDDVSQQKEDVRAIVTTQINGQEAIAWIVPRAVTVTNARASAMGVSGAPTAILRVTRFGGPSFFIGSTFLVPAVGVSGAMGVSMPASGSTTLNLQKDDVLSVLFGGGTGAASTGACVDIVVQNVQDIKGWY